MIRFHPEAAEELRDAARWYEGKREGLGDEFLEELRRTLDFIEQNPGASPTDPSRTGQAALVRRFPFRVVFRTVGNDIQVLACAHTSRHPKYWLKRLDD